MAPSAIPRWTSPVWTAGVANAGMKYSGERCREDRCTDRDGLTGAERRRHRHDREDKRRQRQRRRLTRPDAHPQHRDQGEQEPRRVLRFGPTPFRAEAQGALRPEIDERRHDDEQGVAARRPLDDERSEDHGECEQDVRIGREPLQAATPGRARPVRSDHDPTVLPEGPSVDRTLGCDRRCTDGQPCAEDQRQVIVPAAASAVSRMSRSFVALVRFDRDHDQGVVGQVDHEHPGRPVGFQLVRAALGGEQRDPLATRSARSRSTAPAACRS